MDVTSLYTNILQEEGITIVCQAYEKYHNNNPPIPSHYLKQMLGLILKENSFQFIGENYLQCHGTAMGTKMAVAFVNRDLKIREATAFGTRWPVTGLGRERLSDRDKIIVKMLDARTRQRG